MELTVTFILSPKPLGKGDRYSFAPARFINKKAAAMDLKISPRLLLIVWRDVSYRTNRLGYKKSTAYVDPQPYWVTSQP